MVPLTSRFDDMGRPDAFNLTVILNGMVERLTK